MPKSRRAKVVPLTQTKAKNKEHKDELITKIRAASEEFSHIYTVSIQNVRTNILQQIREERREDSRLFLGNNKLMMIALGRDEETSIKPNTYKLSKFLTGLSGLFFTNLSKKEVKEYFFQIGEQVYARTGQIATTKLTLKPGPLIQFPHNMFEYLTKLGLPLKLDKGVIMLLQETTVCDVGDTLSAEAASILKLFGLMTVEFKLHLTAHWNNGVAKKITSDRKEGGSAENEE
eukprot:Tbor_TRINITY_DN5953_c1_g2::TRINITY_DN5953_c1_g2_i1::g.18505::m.18505/K14815/MRT4; mRNA turnover protein 4